MAEMANILKAIRLLANNLSNRSATGQTVVSELTPAGIRYDLYAPRQAASATYILTYGLTLAGEKDAQLVRFARACASVGLRAAAPDLPGLKSYRFTLEDIQIIAGLAEHLHQKFNGPVGLIGFSAGGSYGLLAAAEKTVDWIDPLLLFGPYYSLDGDHPLRKAPADVSSATGADWEHFIWRQLVFAYRSLEQSDLTLSERAELLDLLAQYCVAAPVRKLEFYQRVFKDRIPRNQQDDLLAGQDLRAFSLCSRLKEVKGRVFMLHDPDDYVIPPQHSRDILAELQARGNPAAQELLVTRLISHVTPRYGLRVREALQAIRILSNLFPR